MEPASPLSYSPQESFSSPPSQSPLTQEKSPEINRVAKRILSSPPEVETPMGSRLKTPKLAQAKQEESTLDILRKLTPYPELMDNTEVMKASVYIRNWEKYAIPLVRSLIFEGGGWYEGTVRDLKVPHGKGRMRYGLGPIYDEDVYEGEWKNGQPDGKGIYTWQNGDKYVGDWREGKQWGMGLYTPKIGTPVKGEWEAGNLLRKIDL